MKKSELAVGTEVALKTGSRAIVIGHDKGGAIQRHTKRDNQRYIKSRTVMVAYLRLGVWIPLFVSLSWCSMLWSEHKALCRLSQQENKRAREEANQVYMKRREAVKRLGRMGIEAALWGPRDRLVVEDDHLYALLDLAERAFNEC